MDKNFVIAILLSTLIVIVFSSPIYQKRFGRETIKRTISVENTSTQSVSPSSTIPSSLSASSVRTDSKKVLSPEITAPDSTLLAQINIPLANNDISIENKEITLTLSPRGGVMTNITLFNFDGPKKDEKVHLIVPGEVWYDGIVVDGSDTLKLKDVLFDAHKTSESSVIFTAEFNAGRSITREFSLSPEGYLLTTSTKMNGAWKDPVLTLEFNGPINDTEISYKAISIWPFSMFMRDDRLDYQKMVFLGDGTRKTVVNGDEKTKNGGKRIFPKEDHSQKIDAKKQGDGTDFFTGALDWYAVRNKYFIAISIPTEKERWSAESSYRHINASKYFRYSLTKKQSDGDTSLEMYLGPISYFTLKEYGRDLTEAMELSFRFIRPLSISFLWIFKKLNLFVSNWGIILVLFSIIIKLLLYPLSKSSNESMQKMTKLQPQIAQIKEKYKNNPQMMQKATMELYKSEGVNPFGGCLPMLLQMPVFFALYPVVGRAFELRQAMFIPHWIDDLSRPDPFYILPIAMGLSMYFQQKQTIKDPSQKAMLYIMPVMMVMFFINLSAGLSLYFFLFNIFSHLQMVVQSKTKTA